MIEVKADRALEACDRLLSAVAVVRQAARAGHRAIIAHLFLAAGIAVLVAWMIFLVVAL